MNVKSAAGVMVYKMNEAKSKSWLSIPAAISVSLVFACAMSLAGICAAEFNAKFELEQLRADFKEIQEANLITEAEIAKSYDLEEIERVAIAKLGMSKPKAHQIVRVNAPAKSYAVDFTDKTDSDGENKGLWSILTDAFASVFK
ncbi:MAG: septum formation initiator family protein [Clostridiales bacterium]|nr:septum formation initiator family protein [Clostridiales bacterium]